MSIVSIAVLLLQVEFMVYGRGICKKRIEKAIEPKKFLEHHDECPICYEMFSYDDQIHRTPCWHYFHVECIKKWFGTIGINDYPTCPYCKDWVERETTTISPFMIALIDGNSHQVRIWLDEGEEIDGKYGEPTPLMVAAKHGRADIVKTLLDEGANRLLEYDGKIAFEFSQGYPECKKLLATPEYQKNLNQSFRTAMNDDYDTAKKWLQKGAEVDTIESGEIWSVLHYAAAFGEENAIQFLLANEADINLKTRDDCEDTPLMVAAKFDNLSNVKFLLKKGANVNLKNRKGKTAHELAKEDCQSEINKYVKM